MSVRFGEAVVAAPRSAPIATVSDRAGMLRSERDTHNADSALAVDASLSLAVRMQIGRFCVFHPGGLCRLGGLRRRGTPHAVLSPGQARRVRDRRAVDLTRLAAYGTSRPGGRLDPSALAMTEALVKHTPRAECPTLPPSPRRGTRHRAGSAVRVTSPALFIGRWDDEVELPEALWIHEGIDLRDLSVSDGERHHGEHSSGGRHHNSRGAVDEH